MTPTIDLAKKLRADLSQELPGWMAPEYWTFVSSIDKTSVGKFDKVDLRKHLARDEYDIITLPGPGTRTEEEAEEDTSASHEPPVAD